MNSLVLLDRDGTINVDNHYVISFEQVELIEGSAKAISLLNGAGLELLVVSNQSAIARGYGTVEDVRNVNSLVLKMIQEQILEKIEMEFVFCPHKSEDSCCCRKPMTGMIGNNLIKIPQLKNYFNEDSKIKDASNVWMIGDKLSDVEFGLNLGIKEKNCILVRTGKGKATEKELPNEFLQKITVFDNLLEASKHIVLVS